MQQYLYFIFWALGFMKKHGSFPVLSPFFFRLCIRVLSANFHFHRSRFIGAQYISFLYNSLIAPPLSNCPRLLLEFYQLQKFVWALLVLIHKNLIILNRLIRFILMGFFGEWVKMIERTTQRYLCWLWFKIL